MRERTDNELVTTALEGDLGAYRELIDRHQKRIFYLGIKFLKNYEDAEDFTQEVFMKTYEHLSAFSGTVPFSAWLYRIAYNSGMNTISRNKRKEIDTEIDTNQLIEERDETPENQLIKKEAASRIKDILQKLPESYNIVIRMRFFDGLSYSEIAEIIGKPINTIKSHIFRAKDLIRQNLEKYFKW